MPISGIAEAARVEDQVAQLGGLARVGQRQRPRPAGVIMPRSPWLASAGWTKSAGVPVEARVAAILRATWPLLPMPVTTTRPVIAGQQVDDRGEGARRPGAARLCSASASAAMHPPARWRCGRGSLGSLAIGGLQAAARRRQLAARLNVLSSGDPPARREYPAIRRRRRLGIACTGVDAGSAGRMQLRSSMGEDVLLGPAGEVELGPGRQEVEAGARRGWCGPRAPAWRPARRAARAGGARRGRRSASCVSRQLGRTPVRALLPLRGRCRAARGRDPSGRAGRCRCGPAARRSWCSRPARQATPR